MIVRVKRTIISISVFVASALTSAGTVFAQAQPVSEPLCPPGNFAGLCNLKINSASGIVGVIIQTLMLIAIIVSIFFLIYGGIRYITSGGDKGKIDQARSTLVAALVGLVISLLAFFIVNLVLIFFTGNGISSMSVPTLLQ
jgi:hypothetical protein